MYEDDKPIKRIVIVGFGIIVFLFIFIGISSFVAMNSLANLSSSIYNHPLKVSNAALSASMVTARMHRDMKDVVLADDAASLQECIDRVDEEEKQVLEKLDVVQDLILGEEGQMLEQKTRDLFLAWRPIREEVIHLVRRGQTKKAAQITKGKGADHEFRLERQMLELTSYAHQKARGFIKESIRVERKYSLYAGIAVLAGTVLSICIAVYTTRQIMAFVALRQKTDRQLIENNEIIKKQLSELENIYQSTPMGLCFVDQNLRYIRINKMLAAINGKSVSEHLGKSVEEVLPDLAPMLVPVYKKVLASGEASEEFEVHGVTAANPNEERDWVVSYNPVRSSSNQVIGVQTTIQDITDRKKAAREKENLQAQLQQAIKMQAVGTLAGGIAHEFNNLLAIIMGSSEMAIDEVPKEHSSQTLLDNILQASHRAADLVKQILTFSRQTQQKALPVNLYALVRESLKLIRTSIPSSVVLREQLEPSKTSALVDPTEIQQILLNLCSNSVWAMKEKGVINVSMRPVQLDKTKASELGLTESEYMLLSVTDNGSGMNEETKSRIFDPFYTEKEVGEGTGMGLSIVYSIMESYEGTISVQTEIEEGSTFNLYFPITDEPPISLKPDDSIIPTGKERILFVDDDVHYARMASEMIRRLGYHVDMNTSSQEALEAFQADPDQYDLVITDQVMPDLPGSELIATIREIRPNVATVLCTGYSSQIDKEKAEEMNITGFAYKPISKIDIAKLIQTALKDTA